MPGIQSQRPESRSQHYHSSNPLVAVSRVCVVGVYECVGGRVRRSVESGEFPIACWPATVGDH